MRNIITYAFFPIAFGSAMAGAGWSIENDVNLVVALSVITLAAIVLIAIAERINPAHVDWNRPRGDVVTDLLHAVFSNLALPELLKFGVMAAVLTFGTETGGFGLWPHDWPLWCQLIMALIIGQFGEYWAHRAMHEFPFLWRFHAVHHSPERLYFLNAARFHPMDVTLLYLVGMTPLLFLGAGPELMMLMMTWCRSGSRFSHTLMSFCAGTHVLRSVCTRPPCDEDDDDDDMLMMMMMTTTTTTTIDDDHDDW